jgi:hypothetical protein
MKRDADLCDLVADPVFFVRFFIDHYRGPITWECLDSPLHRLDPFGLYVSFLQTFDSTSLLLCPISERYHIYLPPFFCSAGDQRRG